MRKISITPIGTCRINTPLKRGMARYPVTLDLTRIYGFVHTSEEALQQLRYRRGELTFASDVLPILFRPGLDCDSEPVPNGKSDLTIVEISSAKSYTIDGVAVQANYLTRYFSDFFASVPRTRAYWGLSAQGDRAALQTFLARDPAYRLYSSDEQSLLARMQVRQQTYDDIRANMAAIIGILGKDHVLFVTHVNAVTPDGAVIASRDKLIRWVTRAAHELGAECFDPTLLMNEFGQERALERDGLDLTHFTNPFCDRWYAKVQRDYVLKSFADSELDHAAAGAFDAAIVADSIAAALAYDDFFDGTHQLFAALKAHPDTLALHLLHGQVLARIGDFDGACRVLSPHAAAPEMTTELRQALMRALLETGDSQGALALACQMLADEYENVEIYEIAGLAAGRLGLAAEALRYRKLAFRCDPADPAAAIAVLDGYAASANRDLYANWLREVLELLEARGVPATARALAEWALARREEEALRRALVVLARTEMALMPALIAEAERLGMESAVAPVAAVLMAMPNLTDKTRRALEKLALGWEQQAGQLSEQGQTEQALLLAKASLAVMPGYSGALRVCRELSRSLLSRVRAAPDDAAVVALCDAAGAVVFELAPTALAYARALVGENRLGDALAVSQKVLERDPQSIDARANLAHIAGINGDFGIALALYIALAAEPGEMPARYQVRTERFLATATPRGVRQIRQLLTQDRNADAIAIWHLLRRQPGLEEQMAAEGLRIRSALRRQMRMIEDDDDALVGKDGLLAIMDLILAVAPDDVSALRRAAIEAMKQQKFEKAIGYWQALDNCAPGLHDVMQFLERCTARAGRQARQGTAHRGNPLLAA